MPRPSDPAVCHYMFTDDIKFCQKAIVRHPTNKNLFLAIHRSHHEFSRPNDRDLPGGNICFPELNIPGLEREVKEETGIDIKKMVYPLITATSRNPEKNLYTIFTTYICDAINDKITIGQEHQAYRRVDKNEFKTLTTTQRLLDIVETPLFDIIMENT